MSAVNFAVRDVITALVMPFDPKGDVDEPVLERLVEFQIRVGVHGLSPCGTTGETRAAQILGAATDRRDRRPRCQRTCAGARADWRGKY